MSDMLIKGGTVIDGTGAPARRADVRVRNGVIRRVAPDLAPEPGERVFDASGGAVCDVDEDAQSIARGNKFAAERGESLVDCRFRRDITHQRGQCIHPALCNGPEQQSAALVWRNTCLAHRQWRGQLGGRFDSTELWQ